MYNVSYNLIMILLLVLIPIMSLLVFFSYRQGLKDGRAIREEKPLESVIQLPGEKPKLNYEIKRMNTIIDNINNYNGGPSGQREVK